MPHRQPRLRTFVAAAIFVLGLFFVDAASGRVLSQADILFQYAPWSASAPARFAGSAPARPGNVLLADIPLVMYPALEITRRNLREGRLPIWNTAMYGGQPFLASYQPALFSPFVVLSVIFAPADALLAHAIVRLLAGGIGMFLFLRRLGLAPPAVWFGALSFLLDARNVTVTEPQPLPPDTTDLGGVFFHRGADGTLFLQVRLNDLAFDVNLEPLVFSASVLAQRFQVGNGHVTGRHRAE